MKHIAMVILMLAAMSFFGCTTMKLNPEQSACTTACVDKKNSCMLTATDANAISACDAEHRTCMEPCMSIPRYVPATPAMMTP